MRSRVFHSIEYESIQDLIRKFLNKSIPEFSDEVLNSTRAIGDVVQEILSENLYQIIGEETCKNYSSSFSRRAMADLAFEDLDGNYYIVDVKTHRLSTKFSMPNLTSVQRLARFYEDDNNYFVVLLISYEATASSIEVENVMFVPIEFLDWDCLTIGALGWGQIQISNSNILSVNPGCSRKTWMIELCDNLLEFYPREVGKINERMDWFRSVRKRWEDYPD